MTWEIAVVLAVVLLMGLGLFLEWARPEFVVAAALAALVLLGIIEPKEALKGFSNEGMLTIALLFIVAASVQQSGVLKSVIHRMMGHHANGRFAMARMMLPVAGFSAFMNNTPIVVMLVPFIRKWCKEHGIAPSKLMMPLSFATVMGGMITLIGTSTNLVVHGLMLENGLPGFSMFTLTVIGLPAALAGMLYLITIGYRLLPEGKGFEEKLSEQSRDYLVQMRVDPDCPLIGKTIQEANLRNLTGLYLFEIIRDEEKILPVAPDEVIRSGDRLVFTGVVNTIIELQQIKGLRLDAGTNMDLQDLQNGRHQIVEVVVSHQSRLVNRTVKQSQFRKVFGAAVIAVHRNQERIAGKIGDIVLKPGDILLLIAPRDFAEKHAKSNDFYFINVPEQPLVLDRKKSLLTLVTLCGMVILAGFQVLSMFKAAILAVLVLFMTRCVTVQDVKRSIQFDVLLLIACAFGIGAALESTGAARLLTGYLVEAGGVFGTVGILALFYLATNIATELLSNGAVVAIMFPIALSTAQKIGVDPTALMVLMAIAASAGFSTPIGYQTNLIVYGPGGYKYSDYVKVGLPLNLLYMVISVAIAYWIWL